MKFLQNMIAGVALVAMSFTLTGCETTGESAGMGAIIGATAGAIIGNQSGSQGEGAVLGAIIGGTVGAIVKDVEKTKAKQTRTAEETVVEYNYTPTQGESLRFENSTVNPEAIIRGQSTTVAMQYALLGSGVGKQVTETRVIKRNGEVVAQISSETFTRNDGTWLSSQEFRIPENWEKGQYTLEQFASTNKSTISGTAKFFVE